MFKFLPVLALLAVSVSATPKLKHRYQENAVRILGDEVLRGGRIVGGADTTIEEYPYQIALFYNRGHTCGGSILNENTVISAAHCTSGRNFANFQVLAGETDLRNGELIIVSQVIEHPLYDDWELVNDIVILKLATQLEFNDRQHSIPLPVPNFAVASGSTTVLAGWGDLQWNSGNYPYILQAVQKPALSNAECQAIYTNEEILSSHLCSGEYGRDACQGDSGGPLVYNGVHVGIVSWGYYCARDYPTVYTRVSEFLPFILQHY